jgi:hypothetical protein
MPNFDAVIRELRKQRDRLDTAIQALIPLGSGTQASTRTGRTMSAAARAKIVAAQRARWATRKGISTPKRRISAAGLARIRAAQRARWAKIKARRK